MKDEVFSPAEITSTSSEVTSPESLPTKPENMKTPGKKFYSTLPDKSSRSIDADGSTVHVVTRVRPLNSQESEKGGDVTTHFTGDAGLWVDNQGKSKPFAFDAVFEPGATQEDVFEHCGIKRLLDLAASGYACTAFAFGQTGSGKTYTMTGPVTPEGEMTSSEDTKNLTEREKYGMIQYSFDYLMRRCRESPDIHYTITASYLEIYNEQVQDLLDPYRYESIPVRWSKGSGFHAENLHTNDIETLDDMMETLQLGMKNRAVAAHAMNDHSSRSHSVLTVHLDSEEVSPLGIPVTKNGKISFVDLAGSEKVKTTGSVGEMLTEATNINRSLLALGNCISALSDDKKRNGHIPFRDSKLTKLLADSLGGSGVTLMVACVSPAKNNLSETLNTLRYAKRAKKIKNRPVIRMDAREELILRIQKDLNLLKQENAFLRNQLNFPDQIQPRNHAQDVEDLTKRPVSENSLYGMLQEYMVENEALRKENENLLTQHTYDEREFGILSRENGRLNRKLEDLERLVLSSPMMMTSENSRTNSGRSHLSIRSVGSYLTPISQSYPQIQPIGPNGSTFPNYALNSSYQNGHTQYNKQHTYQQHAHPNHAHINHTHPPNVMKVWQNTTQSNQNGVTKKPAVNKSSNLPPLKRTPPAGHITYANSKEATAASKWEKAQSYAKQLKQKREWHRVNNLTQVGDAGKRRNNNDVMKDFPLRDFLPPQRKDAFNRQEYVTPRTQHTNAHSPARQTVPLNNAHYNQQPVHQASQYNNVAPNIAKERQVLPQDAYRTLDISPRGSMKKELSATSLRKMNNKMREEIRKFDKEIFNYQKTINAS